MTYGIKCVNNGNIVSVDEDATTYVYLDKFQITGPGEYTFHCAGYPLVFFDIPYNVNYPQEHDTGKFFDLQYRAGLAMRRLRPHPSVADYWLVTFSCNMPDIAQRGMYYRVFGLLHRNFPNGAGDRYGARLWNSQGQLSFDSGCRQLRLAGNTYDTELVINSRLPDEVSEPPTIGDTVVGVPFDLAGKSIMANTRGTMLYPYTTDHYTDFETGQDVYTVSWFWIDALFWATGNALYSRKCWIDEYTTRGGSPSVVTSVNNIYTRVAVIDNALFP